MFSQFAHPAAESAWVSVDAMTDRKALGARGEALAAEHLAAAGMQIVGRNWRCRYGEIDLIARDGSTIAFIEVKTRTGLGYGLPTESVTPEKQARIRRLAAMWLAEQAGWVEVRFDVVAVLLRRGFAPVVEHLPGVF